MGNCCTTNNVSSSEKNLSQVKDTVHFEVSELTAKDRIIMIQSNIRGWLTRRHLYRELKYKVNFEIIAGFPQQFKVDGNEERITKPVTGGRKNSLYNKIKESERNSLIEQVAKAPEVDNVSDVDHLIDDFESHLDTNLELGMGKSNYDGIQRLRNKPELLQSSSQKNLKAEEQENDEYQLAGFARPHSEMETKRFASEMVQRNLRSSLNQTDNRQIIDDLSSANFSQLGGGLEGRQSETKIGEVQQEYLAGNIQTITERADEQSNVYSSEYKQSNIKTPTNYEQQRFTFGESVRQDGTITDQNIYEKRESQVPPLKLDILNTNVNQQDQQVLNMLQTVYQKSCEIPREKEVRTDNEKEVLDMLRNVYSNSIQQSENEQHENSKGKVQEKGQEQEVKFMLKSVYQNCVSGNRSVDHSNDDLIKFSQSDDQEDKDQVNNLNKDNLADELNILDLEMVKNQSAPQDQLIKDKINIEKGLNTERVQNDHSGRFHYNGDGGDIRNDEILRTSDVPFITPHVGSEIVQN